MATNASIVQSVQRKIDWIVADVPELFRRLDIVIAPTTLATILCARDPVLRMLRPLRFNLPGPFSAPILGAVVSDGAVFAKQEELRQLTEEVVILFERLRGILTLNTLFDVCYGNGRLVVLPAGLHGALRIHEVYGGHLDTLHEQRLREEILCDLDSSPSAGDGYSR